jgi:hypothetical protein
MRQAPTLSMGKMHAQRIPTLAEVRAKLDVIVWGSANRSAALRPPSAAHRRVEEDMLTPPPLGRGGGTVGPRPRR